MYLEFGIKNLAIGLFFLTLIILCANTCITTTLGYRISYMVLSGGGDFFTFFYENNNKYLTFIPILSGIIFNLIGLTITSHLF